MKRRRQLVIFLSQVANCVSLNHYTTVLLHATLLQWIFDKVQEDYNITHKGIHFMNLSRAKYEVDMEVKKRRVPQYRLQSTNYGLRKLDYALSCKGIWKLKIGEFQSTNYGLRTVTQGDMDVKISRVPQYELWTMNYGLQKLDYRLLRRGIWKLKKESSTVQTTDYGFGLWTVTQGDMEVKKGEFTVQTMDYRL